MITPQKLVNGFGLNLRLINLQTEGLSHADSLIQTPYNINCLNWVAGHITVNRDNVLELLGVERLLSETQTKRYQRGSEPIRAEDPGILQLEDLLETLGRARDNSKRRSKLSVSRNWQEKSR